MTEIVVEGRNYSERSFSLELCSVYEIFMTTAVKSAIRKKSFVGDKFYHEW